MDFEEKLAAFLAQLPEDVEGRDDLVTAYRESKSERPEASPVEGESDEVSQLRKSIEERDLALAASVEVIRDLKKQNYMDMLRSTGESSPLGADEVDPNLTVESLFEWKE